MSDEECINKDIDEYGKVRESIEVDLEPNAETYLKIMEDIRTIYPDNYSESPYYIFLKNKIEKGGE